MVSRFNVDFNELLEPDLVILSQTDLREDVEGLPTLLVAGLPVEVQEDSQYADGLHEMLFARGVVEANETGLWSHVKWLCRIDSKGVSNVARR